MSVAWLFPGQGSQKVGMGRALFEAIPESRAVFEEADEALGFALSRLCFEGPEDQLQLTANTQPAILATSVAAGRALLARGIRPDWVAGHSLGEYSALVAAGALELREALPLVRFRAQSMQEAVPEGVGAMAAVLMLEDDAVRAACAEASGGEVVEAVNFNAPGQVVIAGHKAAVARAGELCKAKGAKRVVPLPVSAPFHSSLLRPAAEKLRGYLAKVPLSAPRIPLLNNVDVAEERDPARIRDALVRQAAAPVRWVEIIQKMAATGITHVIEAGPGKVLAGAVKRIDGRLQGIALVDRASLEQALATLKGS